jgi:hypothetical protein
VFEFGWSEFVLSVAAIAIGVVPGVWLYRDVNRRNRNAAVWVGVYALALIAPWRLALVPLVFLAWFVLRGGFRRFLSPRDR